MIICEPVSNNNQITVSLRNGSFRIACWPDWSGGNPYQELFYNALKPYGVEFRGEFQPSLEWLRANRHCIDAIHFHWPEGIWRCNWGWKYKRSLRSLVYLLRLKRFLRAAGQFGIKRIWTVHNLEHHEGVSWFDRCGYRMLACKCDLLIVHSQHAASEMKQRYKSDCPIVVMPIGNYDGVYPQPRSREAVLSQLGLDGNKPAVCCVGMLRDYKGIDIAINAVEKLQGDVQLVIAGRPHSDFNHSQLKERVQDNSSVVFIDRKLSEQEFSDIISASEAVLLPYRKITGSSVLLAALSLGRGVIASNLPYFQEVCGEDSDAFRLFPVGDTDAFASAIDSYITIPKEKRLSDVRCLSARYEWGKCVQSLVTFISGWSVEKSTTSINKEATVSAIPH